MLTNILALLCFVLLESGFAKQFPPGHLEPIGNSGPVHPIDRVDGFPSPKVFIEQYLEKNRPLLMKEAAKISPAFNLWSDAYMRSKTPPGKEGNIFVEYGKKENRSDPSGDMHFAEFLDKYNTTDMYMVSHVPQFLKQDIIMPYCIQCDGFNKSFADAVMWFSSGGTKSVLHNDNFENINCLYRGRKRLVFLNFTKYESLAEKLLDVKQGSHSSVDVERVDLEKYPFFAGMDFHIAEMEPGDCLYIPLLWCHHVASFDSNLAVNVWFSPDKKKKIDLKTCREKYDNSLILSKFDYSMKDEGEEPEEEMEAPSGKKEAGKKTDSQDLAGTVFMNLLNFLIPDEGTTISKTEFMKAMTNDEKIKATEQKILDIIFLILDSNRDGKIDDVDAQAKLSSKRGAALTKVMPKWQAIAEKMKLKTPNFFAELPPEEGQPDSQTEAEYDKTVRTTVGPRDEL